MTEQTVANLQNPTKMSLKELNTLLSILSICSLYVRLTLALDPEFDAQAQRFRLANESTTSARYGSILHRWNREDRPASDTNELGEGHPHKSQKDYVCGRAIASTRNRDLLLDDQGYRASLTRTRYRPIEIRMPRIIGGDETQPGEFPWAVSVKLNDQPICGGSLIDKSWILTAAHCVVGYNPKNLTIRLGAYRIKDSGESQTIDQPVSMFVVHKEYSMPRPFSNDIALLKMTESVDFTDYIIPICLPTEDQVSTSTSSVVINDYSNRFEHFKDQTDSGGIVISTKMSDHDIAKCFTKLEQNYLQSIGLGASAEPTTVESTSRPQRPSAPTSPPPPPHQTAPPSQSGSLAALNHLFAAYDPSSNEPLINAIMQPGSDEKYSMSKYLAKNRVKFHTQFQQSNKFNEPQNQDLDSASFEISGNPNVFKGDSYAHYGLPWTQKSLDEQKTGKSNLKFSKLPISKELLHEIQSVGSGPMPALNLALHQGVIMAMASDLTQGNSFTSQPPPKEQDESHNFIIHKNGSIQTRNQVHMGANDADIDDPTKYSGLSGTVVGWGWLRELDVEEGQTNNKGYPSTTLQKVKLPILRNSVCEAWFQSQAKKITLLPSQFCAGFNSGGKDACRVSCRNLSSCSSS